MNKIEIIRKTWKKLLRKCKEDPLEIMCWLLAFTGIIVGIIYKLQQ